MFRPFNKPNLIRTGGGAVYLGQAATRCGYPISPANSGIKRFMSLSGHIATSNIAGLQLVITNSAFLPETADGDITSVTASVEYPLGSTPTQVLFSGVAQGSIASGSYIVSDWVSLSVAIPKGALFRIRMWRRNATAISLSVSSCGHSFATFGDSSRRSTTDDTATVTDETMTNNIPGDNNAGGHFAPVAILTYTREPSVALLGDSRVAGTNDTEDTVVTKGGGVGIMARALSYANIGWIGMAVGGTTVSNFNSGHANRAAIAQAYCSHIMVGYPINDFGASAALATVQTRLQTLYSTFPNQPIFQLTCEPDTTSTSGNWTSDSDQTSAAIATTNVPAFNDWVKSIPTGVKRAFDIAAAIQSPTDRTKWNSDGTNKKYTADGVHGVQFSYQAIATSGAIDPKAFRR